MSRRSSNTIHIFNLSTLLAYRQSLYGGLAHYDVNKTVDKSIDVASIAKKAQ